MNKQEKSKTPEWLLPSIDYCGRCISLKYKSDSRQSQKAKQCTKTQLGIKRVLFLGLLAAVISLCPVKESRANSPGSDPWYFVNQREYRFAVPDKFQHFYGTAALTGIVGPMPALALGVSKEIYDDTHANVGFSVRDIAADVLGIVAAKFTSTENVSLWLDWSPDQETLVLQVGFSL